MRRNTIGRPIAYKPTAADNHAKQIAFQVRRLLPRLTAEQFADLDVEAQWIGAKQAYIVSKVIRRTDQRMIYPVTN